MKRHYLFVFLLLIASSCSPFYKYWDIDQFTIQPDALKDHEPIKILYTSQAPGDNKDLSYFVHVIAVSQVSGDTVNILTTVNNGFAENAADQIMNFISQDNPMASVIHSELANVNNIEDLNRLKKVDVASIKKVVRDPKFDYIADNRYPSVIGWVGTFSSLAPEVR